MADENLLRRPNLLLRSLPKCDAVFRKLKQRLREHGGHSDLTPSQLSVVLRLEKDGAATVSGLARAEGMRPQSMSAVVAPLQEPGLVQRRA